MALFGKKKQAEEEGAVPSQRVKAFADVDLKKYLETEPLVVKAAGDVDWEVKYGEKLIEAHGFIKVPVEMYFEIGDLDNESTADDLKIAQIKINGRSKLTEELAAEADIPFNPLATVDVVRAEAQAHKTHYE